MIANQQEQLSLFEELRRAAPTLSDEQIMRRLCDDLLEEAEIHEPPVPMEIVASLRGIATIERADQPFAGMLQPSANGLEVRVRRLDGYERQRFTIGHETGHTLLPGFLEARQFRCNGARSWLEKMCDVAGAELLLPRTLFEPLLGEDRLHLGAVQRLSECFEASIEATARRAVALASRPSMLIVLSERHKPAERGYEHELPAKLRVDYSFAHGQWPFVPEHKSADENGLERALHGEIIDEPGSIDELCAQPVGEVNISASRFGRDGRVLALIERAD